MVVRDCVLAAAGVATDLHQRELAPGACDLRGVHRVPWRAARSTAQSIAIEAGRDPGREVVPR